MPSNGCHASGGARRGEQQTPENGTDSPEFDAFAKSYDQLLEECLGGDEDSGAVEYFAQGKALFMRRQLGACFSGSILDYGCGHGRVSRHLRPLLPKATLHGFDISAKTISEAKSCVPQGVVLTSDLSELSPGYAAVMAAGVLHHVAPAERPAFVSGLASRLAPGGRLFIFEHNTYNPVTRMVVDRCVFDRGVTLSPPSRTLRLLASAGLGSLRLRFVFFIPPALRKLRFIENALGWCPLGAQYVAMGQQMG